MKKEQKTNKLLCKGLSKVCILLSEEEKCSKRDRIEFLRYADVFMKLSKLNPKEKSKWEKDLQKLKSKKSKLKR